MDVATFSEKLSLDGRILSITRLRQAQSNSPIKSGCVFIAIKDVLAGADLVFTRDSLTCPGAPDGFAFDDTVTFDPEVKSVGTMLKYSPQVSYDSKIGRPVGLMEGYEGIRIKQYGEGEDCDLICFAVNPDQLTALVSLYTYRLTDQDSVIAPMASGCGSVLRIPFGELDKPNPKAVIGPMDITFRVKIPDENLMFFTIPYERLGWMLDDSDVFLERTFLWKQILERINRSMAAAESAE